MRLLGIDYGSKRVGIALGDTDHKMAFPKVVLKNDRDLIPNILKIIKDEAVEEVVIGESKNFKNEDNKIMKEIMSFKEVLEREADLMVVLHPEFMTSAEAVHLQGENNMLDASAAAIILKSYLNRSKN